MNPIAALTMYDAISKMLKSYGIDTDAGIKSAIDSFLEHPVKGVGYEGLKKAWADSQMNDEDLEKTLKDMPYEEEDFEYVEDVNDDEDDDIKAADTTGDGKIDTVAIEADTPAESRDAEKKAEDIIGVDELSSTGKPESEIDGGNYEDLEDDNFLNGSFKDMLKAIVENRF